VRLRALASICESDPKKRGNEVVGDICRAGFASKPTNLKT